MTDADAAVQAVVAAAPGGHRSVPSAAESVDAEAVRAFPALAAMSGVANVAETLQRATEAARRALARVLASQRAGLSVADSDALDLRQREDELATVVRTTVQRLGEEHGGRVLYEVQCSTPRLHAALERYANVVQQQRALFQLHGTGGGGGGGGHKRGGQGRAQGGDITCWTCGESGHTSNNCPSGDAATSPPAGGGGGKRGGPKRARAAKRPAGDKEAGPAAGSGATKGASQP